MVITPDDLHGTVVGWIAGRAGKELPLLASSKRRAWEGVLCRISRTDEDLPFGTEKVFGEDTDMPMHTNSDHGLIRSSTVVHSARKQRQEVVSH
jgi:hypothetical protein